MNTEKCGPSKWHIVPSSNPATDDTPSAGCCGAVSTPRFGSLWRVLRAWPWKVPQLSKNDKSSHQCSSIECYIFLGLNFSWTWKIMLKLDKIVLDKIYPSMVRYIFSNMLIVQIKIPSGLSAQFVLTCSDGSSYPFNAYNDVGWETTSTYKCVARLVLILQCFLLKFIGCYHGLHTQFLLSIYSLYLYDLFFLNVL